MFINTFKKFKWIVLINHYIIFHLLKYFPLISVYNINSLTPVTTFKFT
jgi:hypothetical protein